jgi:hypothetical protein
MKIAFFAARISYVTFLVAWRVTYHLTCVHLSPPLIEERKEAPNSPRITPANRDENDVELELYKHEPLPGPRYIRLLQLKGSRDLNNPTLECDLLIVPLDDNPLLCLVYEAISYTWNAQQPDR